jgi:phenylalanyl-tRNA synthetase beta chain
MYLLFSQLKKYLPDLTDGPKEAAAGFTKIGYMLDKFYEVEYQGKPDFLLDLEVRQNRADCFGVLGLARELSAYYNIPLILPEFDAPEYTSANKASISVEADKGVKRVVAVEIEGVEIGESPAWLKEYLAHYEINSISNLVDLTNYVMIETGHASHAFDRELLDGDRLIWKYPTQNEKFTTLNGEEVEIDPSILTISDVSKAVCLTFIGGKEVEINNNTRNVILEMAVYEGGIVRQNSRKLNITTEAGSRLEKYLDPETIPQAFDWLVSLILENCGGTLASSKTDIYLEPTVIEDISLDLNKLRQIAGVGITNDEAEVILNRLGFQTVSKNADLYTFKSATNRLDVTLEEDLIEEVVRIYGYDQVPLTNISIESTDDITPRILNTIDSVSLSLASKGYNEVRSWVLVSERDINETESDINFAIKTTNSINEEVPYLRSNILMSLHGHYVKAQKNNLDNVRFFEIGKVFRLIDGAYTEHYSLGMLRDGVDLNNMFMDIQALLSPYIGTTNIEMQKKENVAKIMHPSNTYNLLVNGIQIGTMGITNKFVTDEEFTFAEINLETIDGLYNKVPSSLEITQRVYDLDVNITGTSQNEAVVVVTSKLDTVKDKVYSWELIDEFRSEAAEIYTFRISYINLTDLEAKELHSQLFE